MAETALLTLGRMPVSLTIARALHAADFRVIVADPFRRHLAATSKAVAKTVRPRAPAADASGFLDDLLRTIAAENVSLLVPSSEETMHVGGLAARLPAHVRYAGVNQARLLALHDKENFIRLCGDHGLKAPESARLGSQEADALARAGAVIVKPVFGCSGLGLARVRRGDALPRAPKDGRALVQRFVEGRIRCPLTLAHKGRAIATVVYEPKVLSGTVAVAFERLHGPAEERARVWAETFVAKCGHTGFIGFDLIEDMAGAMWGVECNPRVTSGVHYFEPLALGRALGDLAAARSVPIVGPDLRQQFFPCLTETQARMFRQGFGEAFGHLRRAKDVTWDPRDPWPFILMTFSSWEILARTIFKGESFGEAATRDIAWRG